MDDTIIMIAVGFAFLCIFGCVVCISWGDGIVYDTIIPTRHYIDEDVGYHFNGILDTSHCGTLMDHLMSFKVYEFTVSREEFLSSFGGVRKSLTYTCNGGRIENITFN